MQTVTVGDVSISTTSERGHTTEEIAAMCVKHIIHVGENSPEFIKAQAREYQDRIEKVINIYMRKAVRSDRTTIYNAVKNSGDERLAKMILGI